MTLQEYYWLADHKFVQAKSQDGAFVSNAERQSIREMHAEKMAKRL